LILGGERRLRCSFNYKTQQLVTLAKEGDESALDRLCKVYAERVRWMVRLRMTRELRSKLESMDLMQDVLVHAVQGLGDFTYENEGDFVRWLAKIAENVLRDNWERLHAEKRDIRKEVSLGNGGRTADGRLPGVPEPFATTTPSAIMSRKEDLDKLEKAIDTLKAEYREVIVLTKIEGIGYQEIGNRLGKSSEAIRKLVSRAMTALINAFESVK